MSTLTKYILGGIAAAMLMVAGVVVLRSSPAPEVPAPVAGASSQVGYIQKLVSWFSEKVYFGTTQQVSIDRLGNLTTSANIVQTAGTTVLNNVVFGSGGYSSTFSTASGNSQTITAAQFCAATSILIPKTSTTTLTLTLPSAASTFTTCGAVAGGWASQLIDNESSFTVTLATSTTSNINFYVASSTGNGKVTIPYPPTLPASTTMFSTGQYVDSTHLNMFNLLYQRAW